MPEKRITNVHVSVLRNLLTIPECQDMSPIIIKVSLMSIYINTRTQTQLVLNYDESDVLLMYIAP